MPLCSEIDSSIADEYNNITYIKSIENNGEYIIAIKTEPFFRRSEKMAFVDSVKNYVSDKFGISKNNIKVVFDIDILHLIKHAEGKEDLDIIFRKVY